MHTTTHTVVRQTHQHASESPAGRDASCWFMELAAAGALLPCCNHGMDPETGSAEGGGAA